MSFTNVTNPYHVIKADAGTRLIHFDGNRVTKLSPIIAFLVNVFTNSVSVILGMGIYTITDDDEGILWPDGTIETNIDVFENIQEFENLNNFNNSKD